MQDIAFHPGRFGRQRLFHDISHHGLGTGQRLISGTPLASNLPESH